LSSATINVLVVDGSALARQALSTLLTRDPAIHVIDAVSDPVFAVQAMHRQRPDVIVLDIEMRRTDGMAFLRKLMAELPVPVVVCSSLAEKDAATTMEALAAGAVRVVTKPKIGLRDFLEEHCADIVEAVKTAAQADMAKMILPATVPGGGSLPEAEPLQAAACGAMTATTDSIVAIGTSAGGTQALEYLLRTLPRVAPGIVVVQHMPEKFTAAFARRLNKLSEVDVMEARTGDRVMPGRALIAPGGHHLRIRRSGAQYHAEVIDGPLVSRHRPSVDVLFRSVALCAGRNALGIIMTGMGDDGARGLKEMREAGAHTIAQDEKSCVVFGMPKEAIRIGAACEVLPLTALPVAILSVGPDR
jgi:two-component system chemotaxis response regulator CheB